MRTRDLKEITNLLGYLKPLRRDAKFEKFVDLVKEEQREYLLALDGFTSRSEDMSHRALYYQGIMRGIQSVLSLIERTEDREKFLRQQEEIDKKKQARKARLRKKLEK